MISKLKNNEFSCHKSPTPLRVVDIVKVLVSHKTSSGVKNYKYFIGYLHNDDKVNSLHVMLPKTSARVKRYDGQTKWMYFCD